MVRFTDLNKVLKQEPEIRAKLHKLVDEAPVGLILALHTATEDVVNAMPEIVGDLQASGAVGEWIDTALKMTVFKSGKCFEAIALSKETPESTEAKEALFTNLVELTRVWPMGMGALLQHSIDKLGGESVGD